MVPSWLAWTPAPAVGVPVVVRGGQADAQAPEQRDMFLLSAVQRYSACPDGPTRRVPAEPVAVVTVV